MVTITELDDDGEETGKSSTTEKSKSYVLVSLFFALLIDAIGMASFSIPFVGEFADIVWAPISAFLIYKLFGHSLLFAGFGMLEEILPLTDIIPTATLAWCRVNWDSIHWVIGVLWDAHSELQDIKRANEHQD
jgi:hypothetical protein